eukprot:TRINITY_DN443_c0_g1_i1.p1 TRINITY_DN443_c0_g1~~TRINITY_DN443_c0_g1_i1.p1  ORF type:complete len:558 (-),score=91.19 TRINITY_DN443_c0_g1_i1:82-1719(-)
MGVVAAFVLGVLVALCTPCVSQQYYSVSHTGSIYSVHPGKNTSAVVFGYFLDELYKDGWGKLYIESSSQWPDDVQMFAAGYLEAYLTQHHIFTFYTNYFQEEFGGKVPPPAVIKFVNTNYDWTLQLAKSNTSSQVGDYTWHLARVLDQFNGIVAGYNAAASPNQQLGPEELLLLNLMGDIDDIIAACEQQEQDEDEEAWMKWSKDRVETYLAKRGRCSVLVKVNAELTELTTGHTTWGSYYTMNRIWKTYNLHIKGSASAGMSFSGYPGMLASDDDYIMMHEQQLVVTETTNDIINMTLYKLVKPQTVMYWLRAIISCRMASSGEEWVSFFSLFNSGTYNNQWIIVDYKKFTPNKAIQNGTLWILETMPGAVYTEDVSHILEYGYWPSYNRPYFPEVYNAMGYAFYTQKYGSFFSYQVTARANMFRRDQATVTSLQDMKYLMQYNDYTKDPISDGYPGLAISARFDLKGGPGTLWTTYGAHGGMDSKITNNVLFTAHSAQAVIINGPSHQSSACPVFSWAAWSNVSHVGLPETYNFDWVNVGGGQ